MAVGGNVQAGALSEFSVKEIAGDGLGGRRIDILGVNDIGGSFNAEGHTLDWIISADGRIKVTVDAEELHNTYDPE